MLYFFIKNNMEKNISYKPPLGAYLYSLVKLILILVPPAFIISVIDSSSFNILNFLLLLFIFIGLPLFFIISLGLQSLSFVISDTDILITSGILSRKTKTMLLSNIQNIVTNTGPLMSIFRVSQVEIWDASNKNSGGKEIPTGQLVLEKNKIERFQSLVLNRT